MMMMKKKKQLAEANSRTDGPMERDGKTHLALFFFSHHICKHMCMVTFMFYQHIRRTLYLVV